MCQALQTLCVGDFSVDVYDPTKEGRSFAGGSAVQNAPANAGNRSREDPLEEEMAPPPSILAWEIPSTEEPGGYSPWGCR